MGRSREQSKMKSDKTARKQAVVEDQKSEIPKTSLQLQASECNEKPAPKLSRKEQKLLVKAAREADDAEQEVRLTGKEVSSPSIVWIAIRTLFVCLYLNIWAYNCFLLCYRNERCMKLQR